MNIATGRVTAVLTGVLLMSIFGVAKATLVEGFESGTFSGSEATVGDASIKTTYFGIAAPEGTHQLLLTTINNTNDPGYTNQSGNNAVANSTLATFFGVSSSLIRDGTATSQEGSGFTISLGMLTAGTTITVLSRPFLSKSLTSPGTGRTAAGRCVRRWRLPRDRCSMAAGFCTTLP